MKKNTFIPDTQVIQPKILYYGTPVILLTTLNEDHTVNISPISSSWALGDCVVLGLGVDGKAYENLQRSPECVINVPDPSLWENVEKLAAYTGTNPVPKSKRNAGYQYAKDKYALSGLTAVESISVQPTRIAECPLQIEATVQQMRIPEHSPYFAVIETKSVRVHAHETLIMNEHHIDPNRWSPLIYNFRHYFGLGDEVGRKGEDWDAKKTPTA